MQTQGTRDSQRQAVTTTRSRRRSDAAMRPSLRGSRSGSSRCRAGGMSFPGRARATGVPAATWLATFAAMFATPLSARARANPVDDVAPVPSSASVVDNALTLTFSELLDESSKPGAEAFDVTVNGAARTGGESVTVSDSVVTLSSPQRPRPATQ